ncbi:hypothetical protein PtrSN002B_010102 [Pyrenophora tritici-repentis]|uniref:DUF1421 multi-domain protein n=2 Tax=Pyrenophora tritici-repentis TaxID=45151 RepID=A0A2W1HF51_9PLEO|nr:uncharacterized protein PTRG_03345 [Pyrenophora tritici-repentis Pt-1C-BFP]KAF7575347.1 DUF1421 multi-domain protein [Pyrenophora tritici-repentis]EDU45868.1 predicted protein [Pyrenophora tritici-repentis Pt-1C-BFP]KAI0588055.1 hypothetical protein Alg215_01167 [Pyrenophora tritici-repentis]KAI0591048.1 hypothetical protein Alg130_01679 [Pyrenophora tritici-repentis]KAI0614086.1 hypothetical protein TUN205_01691 [Pyrenophora tritici-repentis]
MESLPLETREHIASFLLEQPNYAETESLPVSSHSARNDIYNTRLASRRMHEATTKAFARAIEDSLQNLNSLVALPYVGHNIKSLGFETSRIDEEDFGPLCGTHPERVAALSVRNRWLMEKSGGELVSVFVRTLGLRHLTIIPDQMVPVEKLEVDEMVLSVVVDPFEVSRFILSSVSNKPSQQPTSTKNSTPQNPNQRPTKKLPPRRILPQQIRRHGSPPPLSHIHMTVSAESQFVTSVRFIGPKLTNLNIYLARGIYLGFGAYTPPFFNPRGKPLEDMTISAYGADINYRDLYKTLVELGATTPTTIFVDRLTISGSSIHKATAWLRRALPRNLHFRELVFDDVYLCSENDVVPLFARWRALPVWAEKAGVVKFVTEGVERVVSPSDMFQGESNESEVDDFYGDDMEDEIYEEEGEDEVFDYDTGDEEEDHMDELEEVDEVEEVDEAEGSVV